MPTGPSKPLSLVPNTPLSFPIHLDLYSLFTFTMNGFTALSVLAVAATVVADLTTITTTLTMTITLLSPSEILVISARNALLLAASASLASVNASSAASAAAALKSAAVVKLKAFNGVIAVASGLNFSQVHYNTTSTQMSSISFTPVKTSSSVHDSDTAAFSSKSAGGAATVGVAVGVLAAMVANLL